MKNMVIDANVVIVYAWFFAFSKVKVKYLTIIVLMYCYLVEAGLCFSVACRYKINSLWKQLLVC